MKAIRMFMLMMAAMLVVGSVQVTVAGTKKTEREKREEDKLREKRREERRKRREEFHKVGDAGKHNEKSYANEKERAMGQGLAAAQLAAQAEKTKKAVPIMPVTVGKAMSWSGTLSQQMVKIDPAEGAAKVKVIILTTKAGKLVIFSPKSVSTYSLTGLDLRTMVGKEVTINAMASPRKVENKVGHYVHEIKLMTRKDSGMFDDLE